MIREAANIFVLQERIFLELSSSQLINAVVSSNLGEPGAERHGLVPLIQHFVKLQEDLRRGILGIFPLAKILPADLQHISIVILVARPEKFGANCSRWIQGVVQLGIANG
jgi:hypothetical protein